MKNLMQYFGKLNLLAGSLLVMTLCLPSCDNKEEDDSPAVHEHVDNREKIISADYLLHKKGYSISSSFIKKQSDDTYKIDFLNPKSIRCNFENPSTIDVPQLEYRLNGEFPYKLEYSDMMADSQTKFTLDDINYTLNYYGPYYYDSSVSGVILTLRNNVIINRIPFGEYYGMEPLIVKSKNGDLSQIDLCVNGSLESSAGHRKHYVEGLAHLFEGAPDTIKLTDVVVLIDPNQTDTVVPENGSNRFIVNTSVSCPLVLGETAVLHTTLSHDFIPTSVGKAKEVEIEVKIQNNMPMIGFVPKRSIEYNFDVNDSLTMEFDESIIGNSPGDSEGFIRMHAKLFPSKKGESKERYLEYSIPLYLVVDKDNAGKKIKATDNFVIKAETTRFKY